MPISDEGTGVAIVFATSGFSARLQSVDGPNMSRESINTTHMGTTTALTFMPADLVDSGDLTLTFHFDPSLTPPINAAAETVTITWPVPAGLSAGATWVASAFMTGYQPGAQIGELMTAQATLKISGAITITAAS